MNKILIVDDEPALADTLALIFQKSGYDATAVHSAEAAIPFIEANHPLFMISDVVMPGMTGIELAKHVLKAFPGCAIILFSGNAETQALLELALDEGQVFEVLAKPVSPAFLLAKVAAIAEKLPAHTRSV